MALRNPDGDDTVQWPLRRSATRNDPVPAVFLTPSPLTSKGHQPAELRPLALPVNTVSCLRPISDIFQTKCGMVVVHQYARQRFNKNTSRIYRVDGHPCAMKIRTFSPRPAHGRGVAGSQRDRLNREIMKFLSSCGC